MDGGRVGEGREILHPMIARIIATIVAGIIGLVLGGLAVLAFWFEMAQYESDPSAGGAYVAVAMLSMPIGAVSGAIVLMVLIQPYMSD
jgi:hypothetical protein